MKSVPAPVADSHGNISAGTPTIERWAPVSPPFHLGGPRGRLGQQRLARVTLGQLQGWPLTGVAASASAPLSLELQPKKPDAGHSEDRDEASLGAALRDLQVTPPPAATWLQPHEDRKQEPPC